MATCQLGPDSRQKRMGRMVPSLDSRMIQVRENGEVVPQSLERLQETRHGIMRPVSVGKKPCGCMLYSKPTHTMRIGSTDRPVAAMAFMGLAKDSRNGSATKAPEPRKNFRRLNRWLGNSITLPKFLRCYRRRYSFPRLISEAW